MQRMRVLKVKGGGSWMRVMVGAALCMWLLPLTTTAQPLVVPTCPVTGPISRALLGDLIRSGQREHLVDLAVACGLGQDVQHPDVLASFGINATQAETLLDLSKLSERRLHLALRLTPEAKGEFETTAQYETRVLAHEAAAAALTRRPFTIDAAMMTAQYDADQQVFHTTLGVGPDVRLSGGWGLRPEGLFLSSLDCDGRVPLSQAPALKPHLQVHLKFTAISGSPQHVVGTDVVVVWYDKRSRVVVAEVPITSCRGVQTQQQRNEELARRAAEEAAERARVYKPGDEVTAPRLLSQVKPQYTAEAMKAKIAGKVWLEVVVRPDGRPGDIRVIRSLDREFGLDQMAIRAMRQWRFMPGTKQGVAVPVAVTVEMDFSLR